MTKESIRASWIVAPFRSRASSQVGVGDFRARCRVRVVTFAAGPSMRGSTLLLAALLTFGAVAQPALGAGPEAAAITGARPRIGLVLAGGGAKGGAHVGVIKVLEELRIPIDCIAGTSMGALVGGGYATGLPAAELESFVRGIDWEQVVGGAGRRALEPIEQKRAAGQSRTAIELGITEDREIVTPGGLVDTSSIDDLLRRYVAVGRNVTDFDELPIPYRAVATDMVSGEMVVLDRGDLATAMRASMALPGAFSPVISGNQILADGGMVRNIPVDIARETCADVLIVVNLEVPAIRPEKLRTATQLLSRSTDVMIVANELLQLRTLTDRDIRIDVQMGDISTADFERTPDTIPLGEAAARSVTARLAGLSVPPDEYSAWRARVTSQPQSAARLAGVRYEGLKWVNPAYLGTIATLRAGDPVDVEAIGRDSQRLSALQEIDSAAYDLEGDTASPTLVWRPAEASVGRNVLRPSLGLYGSGGGDFKFQLGLEYARRWLNDRGGQWRSDLEVGYESAVRTAFYQPFDVAQRWFVEPELFWTRSSERLYSDDDRIADYRVIDLGGRVDLGWNVTPRSQLRLGYQTTERDARIEVGTPLFPDAEARDAGYTFGMLYDSRDQGSFATQGLGAQLEYFRSDESLGADRDWERLEAGVHFALPLRRNVVWLSAAGGTDLGSGLPPDRAFSLGGERTLPAYEYDELRVEEYWLVSATFLRYLVDLVPVKNQGLYLGVGLQASGLYGRLDRVEDGEVYGGSVYVGGRTPIGALTLGAGFAEDTWGFWVSLGRPLGKGSILESSLLR
jgi:NTE family protein